MHWSYHSLALSHPVNLIEAEWLIFASVIYTTTGSDNGLSPDRRQAIIWTNVGILLIGPLGTNFSEILIRIQTFSFKKMHLKMSFAKWRPFCLGLNVLISTCDFLYTDVHPWYTYLTRALSIRFTFRQQKHTKLTQVNNHGSVGAGGHSVCDCLVWLAICSKPEG